MEAPRNRQYRATKLWNEVIHSFRGGMPRGKHRRHIRTYDDCFGACEAATWLHQYLAGNKNFGPAVTRHQTLQLLQKFLESHIIEPVRSSKCRVIRDDKQLYRFVVQSPVKTPPSRTPPGGTRRSRGRTPLSSRENGALEGLAPVPTPGRPRGFQLMAGEDQEELGEVMAGGTLPRQGSLCQGVLGGWELHQLWASVTLASLRGLIGDVEDILAGYQVSGQHVAHNMDRLSRNGVVVLLDKTDDLPKWIINAMKCLIHWPRATGSGSCLPNYPGFEADVLKVISDFFCGLGVALVPRELCRLFYCIFATLLDDTDDIEQPPSPDDSIENLLHSMSVLGNPPAEAPPQVKESVVRPISLSSRNLVYSTAFELAEPVTRVESRQSVDHELFQSTDTASTISACSIARTVSPFHSDSDGLLARSGAQLDLGASSSSAGGCRSGGLSSENLGSELKPVMKFSEAHPVKAGCSVNSATSTQPGSGGLARCLSAEELRDFARVTAASCTPKEAVVRSTALLDPRGGFLTLRQIKRDREQRREKFAGGNAVSASVQSDSGGYVNLGFGSVGNMDNCGAEELKKKTTSSLDTMSYVSAATHLDSCSTASFVSASEGGVSCLRYTRNESSCESLPARATGPSYASVTSLREDSCEVRQVVKCLQVSSLLLPPRCRRHLHLLLRFIFKASRNDQLRLCPRRENMQALLDAFAGAFVSPVGELTHEGARELLSFLVLHCDRIFTPPRDLRLEVEARLAILQRGTGGMGEERRAESQHPSYCQRVSREQFEAQKQILSEQALMGLLDDILHNPRISDKERNIRMKQFQHNYPTIYDKKGCEVTAFRRNSRSRATVMGLLRSFRL